MLTPQVLAPRGIYESCFYLITVGTLVLYSVTQEGVLRGTRAVRRPEEYGEALIELTRDLDAADPLSPLMLLE